MRRALLLGLALLVSPSAAAAPPAVSAHASAAAGLAPFAVTLTATGDAVSYRWNLGDGTSFDGAVVQHVYRAPGVYTAVVTATSASGETAEARVAVTAHRLTFEAPTRGTYGRRGRFTGSLWPPRANARVEVRGPRGALVRGRLRRNGGFALRGRLLSRGPFRARVAGFVSAEATVVLRPQLRARIAGTPTVGGRLAIVARLRPAVAGTLVVRVRGPRLDRTVTSNRGSVRVALPTRRVASFRISVEVRPAEGYLGARRSLRTSVAVPTLRLGSRGASVVALERRLRELRYALPRADGHYGLETSQAVLAFQKLHGLPQTARVDARVWRALGRASVPRPRLLRFRGAHIEISKGRQVLMTVRNGRVHQIVHVSTGATGNTPLGSWRVYRKVPGWDWVLWYPMYFLRGFAIHGYPSVPFYPASHGCVRVPMWIAPTLYAQNPHGRLVHIYW